MKEQFHLTISNQNGMAFVRREIEVAATLRSNDTNYIVSAIVPEEFSDDEQLMRDITQGLMRVAKARAAEKR